MTKLRLKNKIINALIILLIISCGRNTIEGDLILKNVNIVDVENLNILSGQTIVVKGNKISSIVPHSEKAEIKAKRVIDGHGKYVMPGLWDMHTHYTTSTNYAGFLNLFIANAVLGVRDLWGDLTTRDSLVASDIIRPRIYLSGHIMDGPFTLLQGTLQPETPEEATSLVDSLYKKGADFIKVYDDLSPEIYHAIATHCNELGLPFAGHVPMDITAIEASNLGQKSIEHMNGIFKSSSSRQPIIDSLEHQFEQAFMQRNIPKALDVYQKLSQLLVSSFDEDEFANLVKVLKKNNTYVTPTLIVLKNHWQRKDNKFREDPRLKYIPSELRSQWNPFNNFPSSMFTDDIWNSGKKLVETGKIITGLLQKEGVSLLAGSDCGVSYVLPGFSLHEELELLVECGLSNGEALQTATLNPAKYFGISDSLGTISVNKIADFVILEDNPLENIANTQLIYGIVQGGSYLNRMQLDELLKDAEI